MLEKTGFTLIIAQLIAYISCSINGSLPFSNIPGFIGFNFFAIIGIILLIEDKRKQSKYVQNKISQSDKLINKEQIDVSLTIRFSILAIVIISLVIFIYAMIFELI